MSYAGSNPNSEIGDLGGGKSYKYLIVNWGGHIHHAVFAIEQKNRAEAAFGPINTYLGFHAFKLESLPAPYGRDEAYSKSYYWRQYVSLPQFDDFAESGLLFRAVVKARAALTAFRVLSVAGLAGLLTRKRRRFYLSIKDQKVRGLKLGAQVLSDFLRCRGRLEFNRSFVRVLFECYTVAHYWLDVLPGMDFSQVLFSNPETCYRHEIARRALLKRGAAEIFSNRWRQGQITLATTHHFGCDRQLCRPSIQTTAELEIARKDLVERLSGALKYIYMGVDVNSRPAIQSALGQLPTETLGPKAVVFLHVISDDQFYYGDDDCFADLDDWLDCSLKMLLEKGYTVYVKPHPMMFSAYNSKAYPSDARYVSYLAAEKGLDWTRLAEGEILKSAWHDRIWLVDCRVGIAALKDAIGNFLAITHHGTVATEAVGLRIPVAWSNANPARNFPEFGFSYRSLEEYADLLVKFAQGKLIIDNYRFENCIRYLAAAKNDYVTVGWTELSRVAGQNIFADPDICENLMLSADPLVEPELHATIRELNGVVSLPSIAIWGARDA